MREFVDGPWMQILSAVAFALSAAGIFLLFRPDLRQLSDGLAKRLSKKTDGSLRARVLACRPESGKPKGLRSRSERFGRFLDEASASVAVTLPGNTVKGKKEKRKPKNGNGTLAALCLPAIGLSAGCAVIGLWTGNLFLAPVLALFGFSVPFLWLRRSLHAYRARVAEELETGLSVLSASYVRSGDLLSAVKENLPYLRSPVREPFAAFLFEASSVDADMEKAIGRLKESFEHPVFREWCDTLAACDRDRTMSDLLLPTAAKLTDERLVNSELTVAIENAKKEYYVMLGLVFGSVPLLFLLNREWFDALLQTVPGRIVTAFAALVAFVTFCLLGSVSSPARYGRGKERARKAAGSGKGGDRV